MMILNYEAEWRNNVNIITNINSNVILLITVILYVILFWFSRLPSWSSVRRSVIPSEPLVWRCSSRLLPASSAAMHRFVSQTVQNLSARRHCSSSAILLRRPLLEAIARHHGAAGRLCVLSDVADVCTPRSVGSTFLFDIVGQHLVVDSPNVFEIRDCCALQANSIISLPSIHAGERTVFTCLSFERVIIFYARWNSYRSTAYYW